MARQKLQFGPLDDFGNVKEILDFGPTDLSFTAAGFLHCVDVPLKLHLFLMISQGLVKLIYTERKEFHRLRSKWAA